jgi:hypothetical protein
VLLAWTAATTVIASMALLAPSFLALGFAMGKDHWRSLMGTGHAADWHNHLWLLILCTGPFALTLVTGLMLGLKVSPNFMIPTFFLVPATALSIWRIELGSLELKTLFRFVLAFWALAILLSPAAAGIAFARRQVTATEPRRELAIEATRRWREAFALPLRIAAGSDRYALALPFYSADRPSYADVVTPTATPWITPDRVGRQGLLVACLDTDLRCLEAANTLATSAARRVDIEVSHGFALWRAPSMKFRLTMIPPASSGTSQ